MTTPFDASFAYAGPISDEVKATHASEIANAMPMVSKLANAKLHATNELQRWVLSCNRFIWGEMPAGLRQPEPGEIAALLEQLGPEHRERLLRESQLAAEQRHLIELLISAEADAQAILEAQRIEDERAAAEEWARQEALRAEQTAREEERALWEEFEAVDAAGKEARFQAWRAARQR